MNARWLGLLGLLWMLSAFAEVAVPPLHQRVTDLTGTLSAPQVQTLEAKLADFEGKKGSQIAVLIVPTTQPEAIEQYSIRVVEAWKLGRKGVDDGVLLLVAKNDRKLRIEVGRGLEGALNDATAKRIIAEIITPPFKQGDFVGGINAGTDSIIKVVSGEALPPVSHPPSDGFHLAASPPPETLRDRIISIFLGITLQGVVILFFVVLYALKLLSVFYRYRFGKKLINNQYVQQHPLLQKLIIVGEAIELSSDHGSSGGGSSGSSSGGGSYSGGGGGSFGGGGSSGSW